MGSTTSASASQEQGPQVTLPLEAGLPSCIKGGTARKQPEPAPMPFLSEANGTFDLEFVYERCDYGQLDIPFSTLARSLSYFNLRVPTRA